MLGNTCKRWLVVSAHPDDETLGAGGTLHRLKAMGCVIHWLNVCDMKTEYGYPESACRQKARVIDAVAAAYGFDSFTSLGLKPAALASVDEAALVGLLGDAVAGLAPEGLIMNSGLDAHSDHRALRNALQPVLKGFRYPSLKAALEMEILSETNLCHGGAAFAPNLWVDITAHMGQKLETLALYETELGLHPFPRSLEAVDAQALLRGSEAGVSRAEAYRIVKLVE